MARAKLVLLVGLVLATAGLIRAQDKNKGEPPPAGTWKVTLPTLEEARGRPVVLLKLEKTREGKWKGEIIDSKLGGGKSEVEKLTVSDKACKFTIKTPNLTMTCDVNLTKDAKAKLYGEGMLRKDVFALEMERTTMASLDGFDQLREELASEPLGIRSVVLARVLLSKAEEKKVNAAEARKWADKAIKSAQMYGPSLVRETLLNIAGILAEQKGFEATALQYAQRAENGLDEKAEGPVATKKVLDVLAEVQEKAGKKDDAVKTLARIKKLDFRIKPIKFAGRKAKNDRVVLAEVFTGSQAKSCVAASMALESLSRTFKPTDVTVIAYHLQAPEGDPLGSPESDDRREFYGDKNVPSVPVMILNGKVAVPGGGGAEDAQESYERYVSVIEPLLETDAKAQLKLKATQKGDKITISADVGKLEETGDDVRLRLALVESETSYKGSSGVRVHYNVVRAMPGGAEGTVMKAKSDKKSFTVDLADLRKKLLKYQEEADKKRPFPGKERPLDLKKLRVIAFIQNDRNNEVLQAAQADVTAE